MKSTAPGSHKSAGQGIAAISSIIVMRYRLARAIRHEKRAVTCASPASWRHKYAFLAVVAKKESRPRTGGCEKYGTLKNYAIEAAAR
jgi:hypothetical protein